MEEDFLLTFELDKNSDFDVIFIHADRKGLRSLIEELQALEKWSEKKSEHIHLFTKEWGGGELSSDSQGGEIINHVKIYCWNEKE